MLSKKNTRLLEENDELKKSLIQEEPVRLNKDETTSLPQKIDELLKVLMELTELQSYLSKENDELLKENRELQEENNKLLEAYYQLKIELVQAKEQ